MANNDPVLKAKARIMVFACLKMLKDTLEEYAKEFNGSEKQAMDRTLYAVVARLRVFENLPSELIPDTDSIMEKMARFFEYGLSDAPQWIPFHEASYKAGDLVVFRLAKAGFPIIGAISSDMTIIDSQTETAYSFQSIHSIINLEE